MAVEDGWVGWDLGHELCGWGRWAAVPLKSKPKVCGRCVLRRSALIRPRFEGPLGQYINSLQDRISLSACYGRLAASNLKEGYLGWREIR